MSPMTKRPLGSAEVRSLDVDPATAARLPLLRSQELFSQTREILIEHAGSLYRLRLTHSNKLILTK
jgi:hemin uptake protein HemP